MAVQFVKVNPENWPEVKNAGKSVAEVFKRVELCKSISDARRMIKQGAIKLDGQKVSCQDARLIIIGNVTFCVEKELVN